MQHCTVCEKYIENRDVNLMNHEVGKKHKKKYTLVNATATAKEIWIESHLMANMPFPVPSDMSSSLNK